MSRILMLGALGFSMGCAPATEPLVFEGITQIVVQKVASAGLARKEVGPDLMPKVTTCLQSGTREVSAEAASTDLLAVVYLIEVNDKKGARSFELYTARNFKYRGIYYENKCLFELVSRLGI